MITMIELFLLLMLILLSAIDLKSKTLPSVLTTSVIFILALVNFGNILYGLLGFIFAWLLMEGFTEEGQFFSGIADLKVTVMLSLMVTSLGEFFLLVVLILVFGVVYKAIMVKFFKQREETAFIPVFLLVYITMLIVQAII